ncbi:hypothetical protein D9M68_433030 [compost metagenome]
MFSSSGANLGEPTMHQALRVSTWPLVKVRVQVTGPSEMSSCQPSAPAKLVIGWSPPAWP